MKFARFGPLIIALGSWAPLSVVYSADSKFEPSSYSASVDQYTASPQLADAVSYRVVLALAGDSDQGSLLSSMISLTQTDLQNIQQRIDAKRQTAVADRLRICDGVSEDPTEAEVVSFGIRMNRMMEEEDARHAQLYRQLMSELSPTASAEIGSYVDQHVIPSFKTQKVDFARLFGDYPSAFQSNVAKMCEKKSASGELR
ncbi:MAG: hypothetical protein R3E82_11755 [Pseudomonadales bacterium]